MGQVIRESDETAANEVEKDRESPKIGSSRSAQPTEYVVWGQKLKNAEFDYPVIVNKAVEHWIAYFTGKGRTYFDKYLQRSFYFIPTISRVLKTHNMPQDLVYLAMIESGFNNSAKSRARAVGPWQFIRQTGQRYGLRVDYWLDERRDTRKSTLAAIAYLKELYEEFGSWELAAAGYNAGENKVRRAIAKYKTHDFWEISKHRFFRRETRDYVPKIMAAAIISKNPELFGFDDPFKGKGSHSISNTIALASDKGEQKTEVEEEPTPKELGEPVGKVEEETTEDVAERTEEKTEEVAEDEDLQEDHAIVSQSPIPTMTPSVYMVANPNEQIIEFEIKGPADLFAISKASGLPFSSIKMLNPELLRWCTPPDMKTYRVKLPLSVKERFLATYNDDSFDRRVVFMRYTVKRGDTVGRLARKFGVEGGPIRQINSMGQRTEGLRAGSQISLPIPTGYKRVIASMYDDKPVYGSKKKRRRVRGRRQNRSSSAQQFRLKPNVSVSHDRS
ncbi:MAG: transglycosylase SLT domain-containing protein [Bdellovibrionota bacterium]